MIKTWAKRHGVSDAALSELVAMFNTDPAETVQGESETAVQNRVRLEASRAGCRLWRNNVGAVWTDDGTFIRYGLCNDSKPMNDRTKSSDLIGIRPVLITPGHVGRVIGQFLAREVKYADWKFRGIDRENGQLNFMLLVASLGGDAQFATGEGTI